MHLWALGVVRGEVLSGRREADKGRMRDVTALETAIILTMHR